MLRKIAQINKWVFCELMFGELFGGLLFTALIFSVYIGLAEAGLVCLIWPMLVLTSLLVAWLPRHTEKQSPHPSSVPVQASSMLR